MADSQQLRRMRRDWDRRARENARHYVLTGQESWSDEEFFRAGDVTMQEDILNDLGNICQGKDPKQMSVLEIGCGAGRVTRAFAKFFGEVYAVDISREMVAQARRAVAEFPNAHVFRNNGKDLRVVRGWRRWIGLARRCNSISRFRRWFFNTSPAATSSKTMCARCTRLLRPGGLFKFQVQGAPDVDAHSGDTWVGASFSEADARADGRALRIRNAISSRGAAINITGCGSLRPPLDGRDESASSRRPRDRLLRCRRPTAGARPILLHPLGDFLPLVRAHGLSSPALSRPGVGGIPAPAARCRSSSEAITRSSFSFSAYRS